MRQQFLVNEYRLIFFFCNSCATMILELQCIYEIWKMYQWVEIEEIKMNLKEP